MPKPSFHLIKKKIKEANHILLASHVSADYDAAGSVLALERMLKRKRVTIFIPSFDKEYLGLLPGAEKLKTKLPKEKVDVLIAVDHGRLDRAGVETIVKRDHPFFISIDHHPRQTQGGDIQWIDPTEPSTTVMVYKLAKEVGLEVDKQTAWFLLLGLASDTHNFSQPGVTVKTLETVIELLKKGASLSDVQSFLLEWSSPEEVKAFAHVVSKAKIDYPLKFISAAVDLQTVKKLGVAREAISGFSNNLRMFRGVEVALLMVEQKNSWRCHLRSRPESTIDMGKVAAAFGGGGHFNAAGFKTQQKPAIVIRKIKMLLRKKAK
jgi:phosphoesterase RecJ-like protein